MISTPTPENPLLVGILVDVSGSMTSAIDNRSGRSQNRLEAFEEALRDLAQNASSNNRQKGGHVPVEVFCYGFGFGGLGTILFGSSGPSVRDLFAGVSGGRLVHLDEIADNWNLYDRHVRDLAKEMFGSTPMASALETAVQRFNQESRNKVYCGQILFILSDGDPTDATSADIQSKTTRLKQSNIAIVSCYVTSQDITEPRVLYDRAREDWPDGARLMLECASPIDVAPAFGGYLREYGWIFRPDSRIFCQINHTDILREFMNLLISPMDREYGGDRERKMNIFVSYAHEDAGWVPKVEASLRPLSRGGRLEVWSDRNLDAGSKWRDRIAEALAHADVAILLVSPDFLASDFIASHELPSMLERNASRGLRVIPILIRPSLFGRTPELAQFQSLNPPERPLTALNQWEQDQYLVDLADQLVKQMDGQ